MKVAKQAVAYYCAVTGNEWSDFFSKLDQALADPNPTGEMWLIKKLMKVITESGITVSEFRANKDAIKKEFDDEGRKNAGEFFTPIVWAEEGHKLIGKYIPNWRDMYLWECSAGSGNLVKTANMSEGKLFMSTLQQDDVDMLKTMPEFAHANVFQCDFLEGLDYDVYNTDFLNKLPQRLQEIIRNDEPLIIYANPPYKVGSAKMTDVGNYMSGIGLSKAACDIYYQFVWRVMHFVEMFNLNNLYFCHFGPLAFFTGSGSGKLLAEYEHCFEFVDGMCLAAQEFSDTSSSISWGIGCTLWKARGGYMPEQSHKDILLEKKYKLPDGTIGCEGRVLYAPPRQKLSEWVQPTDVLYYEQVPLMTSHLTFKGSEINVKVAPFGAKMAKNALGTLMSNNTFTRVEQQSAVLSMPSTIQHCDITEENFWRCVASYTFRRLFNASWAVAKKEISAPNTKVEGYSEWLANSLVIFLFDWNSMMSAIRNVEYGGSLYQVRNKLFYCSEQEIRENCTDEKILEDVFYNPAENEFMLRQIELARKYWKPEIKELFDFCKGYTLATLNLRKTVNYEGSLDCWDAGFQQIRSSLWENAQEEKLKTLLSKAKDVLRENLESFGFISEVEGE